MNTAASANPVEHWAPLVPELGVSNFAASLAFYTELLGFRLCYAREGFVYLEREKVQLMLEDVAGAWSTGEPRYPFGRGINFQIETADAAMLYDRLRRADWPIFGELSENWYRAGVIEHGQREFLIQDPDGYLLRFAQPLGERSVAQEGTV